MGSSQPLTGTVLYPEATCEDVLLGERRRLRAAWVLDAVVVHDIWNTIRAVTLHFIWSERARCPFDDGQPTHAASALLVIFSNTKAHLWRGLRHRYDDGQQRVLQRAMTTSRLTPLSPAFCSSNLMLSIFGIAQDIPMGHHYHVRR